jgi:hypothetical protein
MGVNVLPFAKTCNRMALLCEPYHGGVVKKVISLVIACACILPNIGMATLPRNTADYYKINPTEYLDEEVNVYAFSSDLLYPTEYNLPGYRMLEIETAANESTHGGSIIVAVPTDELIKFKKEYSGEIREAENLTGILRQSSGERSYLYIEYGSGPSEPSSEKRKQGKPGDKQYTTDYYELLAEEYVGQKITIQATSAVLDKSDRLNHINNSIAFIVNTPNERIKDGQIAVVVPNEHASAFAKAFMKNAEGEARYLSGYLYKHQAKETSFLFLYCSNEPLDLAAQKPSASRDHLHELIAIYMDLDDDGRDRLIEFTRKLESPNSLPCP